MVSPVQGFNTLLVQLDFGFGGVGGAMASATACIYWEQQTHDVAESRALRLNNVQTNFFLRFGHVGGYNEDPWDWVVVALYS